MRRRATVPRFCALWLAVIVCCAGVSFAGEEQPQPFDWRQCADRTVRVMLNHYPYAAWIKRGLRDFEKQTGIRTAFAEYPDERYFFELDAAFEDPYAQPDVYLTAVHQAWDYAAHDKMLPLDGFLNNPALTHRNYNISDFYPPILAAFQGIGPQTAPGADDTETLWAIPMGFVGDDPESARSNLLVFGLAVNPKSENRDAAWLFLQYFTSQTFQTAVLDEWKTIRPPRRSVFENPVFQRAAK